MHSVIYSPQPRQKVFFLFSSWFLSLFVAGISSRSLTDTVCFFLFPYPLAFNLFDHGNKLKGKKKGIPSLVAFSFFFFFLYFSFHFTSRGRSVGSAMGLDSRTCYDRRRNSVQSLLAVGSLFYLGVTINTFLLPLYLFSPLSRSSSYFFFFFFFYTQQHHGINE